MQTHQAFIFFYAYLHNNLTNSHISHLNFHFIIKLFISFFYSMNFPFAALFFQYFIVNLNHAKF